MTSPFTAINTAAIRAEARHRANLAGHLLCLIILAAALTALAHLTLQTALALPDLTARAAALKGM